MALVEVELLHRLLGGSGQGVLVVLKVATVESLKVFLVVFLLTEIEEVCGRILLAFVWVRSIAKVLKELSQVLLHLHDLIISVHVAIPIQILFRICLELISLCTC